MYFSLKFIVWLKWRDDRLDYQNLNQDQFQNVISKEVAMKLWKPRLIFDNHIGDKVGGYILEYSPISSALMLVRNGNGTKAEQSRLYEARIYSSSQTELLLRTIQFMKFECHFDLQYFPFDEQTCSVKVRYQLLIIGT